MILMIYPYYAISILLYRLYSTILCIWLYMLSYARYLSFIYAYVILCTFMMIHSDEHIYFIHLPILSMLSSGAFLYFLRLQCCFTSIWYTYLCSLLGWLWYFLVYTWYIPFIYLLGLFYDSLYKLYPSFYIKSGYFLSLFYLYSKNH